MINDHYQTRKERRRKEERKRYQNLSEEEKTKGEKGPIKISKFNWRRKREKASVLSWT